LRKGLASNGKINRRTRTPYYAIFFSYTIIVAMALVSIEAIASAADIMFLILFIQVNLSLVVLRYRRPDLRRSFKVPLVPYLPLAAVILQIVIGYFLITELKHGVFVIKITVLWLMLGSLIYFAYSEKEKLKRLEEKTVYEEVPVRDVAFKVLVPIANPKVAPKLARLAYIFAKERKGEIIFLNVITVPSQTPLSAADRYVKDAKKFVQEIMELITDVPVGGVIKIGHKPSEAILNAIGDVKPDLVVLGWRGRTFRRDFVLGSTIDPVLVKAKCDVAVVKFGIEDDKNILIPTAGGPHAILAAELAKDLAKYYNSRITLMYVGRESDRKIAEKAFKELEDVLEGFNVSRKFMVSLDAVDTIAKESEKYGFVLIGSTNQPFLKNFLLGIFPEKIVRKSTKTVIMTRKWIKLIEAVKR